MKTCVVICCNAWFHFGCVQMSNKILKEIGEEIGIVHCVKNKIRNYQQLKLLLKIKVVI